MLYKKNKGKELDMALFQNPSAEYRGTPFWAWNCKLNREQILRQIDYFKEMGFGGSRRFDHSARSGSSNSPPGESARLLQPGFHASAPC